MKNKLPIILIVLASALVIAGAFFKILHWKGANLILITGFILQILGAIWAVAGSTGKREI